MMTDAEIYDEVLGAAEFRVSEWSANDRPMGDVGAEVMAARLAERLNVLGQIAYGAPLKPLILEAIEKAEAMTGTKDLTTMLNEEA